MPPGGNQWVLTLALGAEFWVVNVELPEFEHALYVPAKMRPQTSGDLFRQPVKSYARHTRPFRELKALSDGRFSV